MYSDMSMRTIASSSPNRNSARVRACAAGHRGRGRGALGLAAPRGPGEEERAGRPLRVLESRARAADRLRDGLDRRLVADDAPLQLVLHPHQLLGLGLGELEDRDAGPHRDDVGDLLLGDRRALAGLTGTPLLL